MRFNPDIIKSNRKTICIEVRPDGKVTVRAPISLSYEKIEAFIEANASRIEKSIEKYRSRSSNPAIGGSAASKLTPEELAEIKEKAKAVIPHRVAYYAPLVGVTYGKIKIKTPKTRWGSCSSKGDLNFNALLVLMPPEVMDSVIVHELCHRKEMNHSPRFYEEVLRVMPDYHKYHGWLKAHGSEYLMRLY